MALVFVNGPESYILWFKHIPPLGIQKNIQNVVKTTIDNMYFN